MITKNIITSLKILAFMLITIGFQSVKAQKFFIGYGLSIYTDFAFLSPAEDLGYDTDNTLGVSILSISAEMKYNLYEFNSETALSIAASPRLGTMAFDSFDDGFGNFSIPIYAQIDFGNLSTYDSKKNSGFGLGVGYQFDRFNLFGDNGFSASSLAFRGGYRYFNRNNKAREIAVKYALPANVEIDAEVYDPVSGDFQTFPVEFKVSSVQLTWILYFNY